MLWTGVLDVLDAGKMMSVEWVGQTIASGCWIVSVFVYGEWGTGDWLQFTAACSWMLANLSSAFSVKGNKE